MAAYGGLCLFALPRAVQGPNPWCRQTIRDPDFQRPQQYWPLYAFPLDSQSTPWVWVPGSSCLFSIALRILGLESSLSFENSVPSGTLKQQMNPGLKNWATRCCVCLALGGRLQNAFLGCSWGMSYVLLYYEDVGESMSLRKMFYSPLGLGCHSRFINGWDLAFHLEL